MTTADWNLLFYLAADVEGLEHDAAGEIVGDLTDACIAAKTDAVNVFIECVTQSGSKRVALLDGEKSEQPIAPVDTSDPQALASFLSWGAKIKAKNTALFIFGHGNGADDAPIPKPKVPINLKIAFNHDDEGLSITDLADVLRNAPNGRFGVLGMNACQMNAVEIAYEVRDCVTYMIGSVLQEAAIGWPYGKIFRDLVAAPSRTPEALVQIILDAYSKNANPSGATNPRELAAVTTARSEAIAQTMIDVVDALKAALKDGKRADVLKAHDDIDLPLDDDCVDLRSFFAALGNYGAGDGGAQVTAAIVPPVVKVKTTLNLCGLSLYFPTTDPLQLDAYAEEAFPSFTGWSDFLRDFVKPE